MSLSIYKKQQSDYKNQQQYFVKLHKAKDRLYKDAEFYWWLGLVGTLFASVGLLLYNFCLSETKIEEIITVAGAIISFGIAKFIANLTQKKRYQAARIQEEIDTELFELDWNKTIDSTEKERPETISKAADRFTGNSSRFLTWYSVETEAVNSILQQALLCQRENISFDIEMRKLFSRLHLWIFGILGIVILVYAWWQNPSARDLLLAIIAPLAGLIAFLWDNYSANQKIILEQEIQEPTIRKLLQKSRETPESVTKIDLRSIQDFIFQKRRGSSFIPNFLYGRFRAVLGRRVKKGTAAIG